MEHRLLRVVARLSFLLCILSATNSTAATHVVNSPDDASLRAAIAQGGWIGFGFNGTVTLTNTIPITTDVFLDGSGVDVTISGGNAVRLFSVAAGVTFGVTNLTLANGTCLVTNLGASADGGAIYNAGGKVTLIRCTLTNNRAQYGNGVPYGNGGGLARGGAIFQASGSITVEDSFLALNQALGGAGNNDPTPLGSPAYGGAVVGMAGDLTLKHSQFIGNAAQGGNGFHSGYAGPAFGGAVYSGGSLAATDSSFIANQALAGAGRGDFSDAAMGYGGAIYNSGTAAINGCSVYSNAVQGGVGVGSFYAGKGGDGSGGGIFNAGTAALNGCSVYSNAAQGGTGQTGNGTGGTGGAGLGGALFNAAQLGATNCTLALNSSSGGAGQPWNGYRLGTSGNAFGGGVFNNTNATFAAMNLTIASNTCSSPSGLYVTNGTATGFQIANTNGTLRLHNSLLAYSGTNANAYGTITDDGYNICSDGSAQLFGGASYNFTDPKLGPLGDYGGPTLCMALLPGSPAINNGDPAHSPNTDQRGFVRPIGAGPDIGAYESSAAAATGCALDVSVDGSGIVTKNPVNGVYPQGVTVTVTAVENDGWHFDHWSGDAIGSLNPLNVTMNTSLAIMAHFLPIPTYTVTLQTNGQGTIVLNPPGGRYLSNSLVTATATPGTGWGFDSWSGPISSTTNPLALTINSNLSLIGTFRPLPVNCVPPPSGLVGWWRGEGDGKDASGNNNTGTLQGGVSFAPGIVGQAFSFDATNGTVIVPDSPSLWVTNQLTIEAWINTRSTNADRSIVARVGGPSGISPFGYQFVLSRNSLLGQFNSPGLTWPLYGIRYALPVAIGTWCHAAWTYDQSAMKLYWNGQPVATNVIGAHPIATYPSSRLHISADDVNHTYFDGLIDEPSVYSRALSDNEIAAIYNALTAGKCTSQQARPYLSIILTASNVVVSYPAAPTNLYCLQASTNLLNWTNLGTNGPFAGSTNVMQTISLQGFKARYFRVRMQ